MNRNQEEIYAENRVDLIIPYGIFHETLMDQILAPYTPTRINDQFAVIHVPIRSGLLLENVRFVYSVIPKLYVPLDTTSLEVSGILQTQVQEGLQLSGKGILLGFVDTGINYTHPAFRDALGKTRIVEIWDQTQPSETGDGPFGYGTVYTATQIQEALRQEDSYRLVPTRDEDGHGTYVAGVAGGSANLQQEFVGAAPDAQIAMVKLKEAKPLLRDFYYYTGKERLYQENDIMTGVQYLVDLAVRKQMPLVICIALGSNQGDHMGFTPLEMSLQTLNSVPNLAVVTAAGNEAGKAHHFFGRIYSQSSETESYENAEILVSQGTTGFSMELWGAPPELFSVGFRSPTGETIPRIPARLGQMQMIPFFLERTRIELYYELVQNTSGSQLIFFRFTDPTPGIWNVQIYASNPQNAEFHIWLPISGAVSPDIRFLSPDPYTTITAPGNTVSAITAAAYDAYNGSIYLNSSRGYTRNQQIKPDLSSPGVRVSGPGFADGYTQRDGTSVAAALTAGSCALLMEWGLNLPIPRAFSSYELKNLLIRGARRDPALSYPNREWGYGTLQVYEIFRAISTT